MNKEILKSSYLHAILFFFIFYCIFMSASFWFQNVDDAYISFRYGQNLMNGHGLVYNPGEYVEGYTNFLWTVITAPFTIILGVDISFFALSLGLIISVINIYLIVLITQEFHTIKEFTIKYLIFLPAALFAVDNSIAFWAIGGMEFPIYTFFILAAIYSYFRINNYKNNYIWLSIFMILTTLTRPEGNMIAFLFFFHMFLKRELVDNFRRKFLSMIIIYGVFVIIYYGFKYIYYGSFLPNTFYAKGVTDLGLNLLLGSKYLAKCLGSRIYIFFFILFIPLKRGLIEKKKSFLILLSIVYLIYLVAVGGDWMFANRFFVPIIPVLYILSVWGIINFIQRLKVSMEKRVKYFNLTSFAIIIALFITTMTLLEYNQLIIKDENYKYEMQWSMFGKWLKMNVSPETVIAVGPAGKIPYYSELYTVDMWGLNDAHIAATRSKRPQAGHKKFDFEYVLSRKPEFIIGYAGFDDNDMPPEFEKFNAPEEDYRSIDIVFRLKPEFRTHNR